MGSQQEAACFTGTLQVCSGGGGEWGENLWVSGSARGSGGAHMGLGENRWVWGSSRGSRGAHMGLQQADATTDIPVTWEKAFPCLFQRTVDKCSKFNNC